MTEYLTSSPARLAAQVTTRTYAVPDPFGLIQVRHVKNEIKTLMREAGLVSDWSPQIVRARHNGVPEFHVTITGPSRVHSAMLSRYAWTGK